MKKFLPFVISFGGNAWLVWLFFSALVDPSSNPSLVAGGPIMIVIELLSIHSAGMFGAFHQNKDTLGVVSKFPPYTGLLFRIGLVAIYGLFALTIGIVTHNLIIPIYFMLNVIIKASGLRAIDMGAIAIHIPVFLISIFSFVMFGNIIETLVLYFSGSSENFMLAWGVIYYGLLALIQLVAFILQSLKSKNNI